MQAILTSSARESVISQLSHSPDLDRLYSGIRNLYGERALTCLQQARVSIVGLGGVGSWTAEALARSGVGYLQLVDMDHIAESNMNRQIHALATTIGQAKGVALQERIAQINPKCQVHVVDEWMDAENIQTIWAEACDISIDCTDDVQAKIAMILYAKQHRVPLIVCGGAGGKVNPLGLRQTDLVVVQNDALLAKVRAELRRHHGYPKGRSTGKPTKLGVECIWLDEPTRHPQWDHSSHSPGAKLACAGYGSLVTVTASMGLVAAQSAINYIIH